MAPRKQGLEGAQGSLTGMLEGTGGPAGPAVAALRAAGIDSVPLLDLVTLPESDRLAWEGRLSPYERTVVVSRADVDAEMVRTILAAHPGTPVIVCDGPIDVAMKASPESREPSATCCAASRNGCRRAPTGGSRTATSGWRSAAGTTRH